MPTRIMVCKKKTKRKEEGWTKISKKIGVKKNNNKSGGGPPDLSGAGSRMGVRA